MSDEHRWIAARIAEVRRSDEPESDAYAQRRGLASERLHVVVLQEQDGARQLPIWIGPFEAAALAVAMESVETPRPMSYQLMSNLVAATGGKVRDVRVTRLAEGTFYAEVLIGGAAGNQEVDARPSDALNLALVAGCPIWVDEAVLEEPWASRYDEWSRYPESSTDIAADVRRQQTKMQESLETLLREAEERDAGDVG